MIIIVLDLENKLELREMGLACVSINTALLGEICSLSISRGCCVLQPLILVTTIACHMVECPFMIFECSEHSSIRT
jgi:hypothetical protein